MFKELEKDENVEFTRPNHGDLTSWADQGVVLLNACLTVTAANANSHKDKGWYRHFANFLKNNRILVF